MYQITFCAVSFAAVSNLKHVVTRCFETKIVGKKVNNNNCSLDRLYKCKFFLTNRKLAKKRPSLHFYAMIFWWKKGLCIGMAMLPFQKHERKPRAHQWRLLSMSGNSFVQTFYQFFTIKTQCCLFSLIFHYQENNLYFVYNKRTFQQGWY